MRIRSALKPQHIAGISLATAALIAVKLSFSSYEPNHKNTATTPTADMASLSRDLADAVPFFEALGYRYCRDKSEAQRRRKLWMHLRRPERPTCADNFRQFLELYNVSSAWPPPVQMPENLKDRYLLYGRANLSHRYFASRYEGAIVPRDWSPAYLQSFLAKAAASLDFHIYGGDTQFLYKVLRDFPLTNMTGLVIGSETPWVEAILLAHGKASKVFTVEYHPIKSTHPQIEYVSPASLSSSWEKIAGQKIDFAFTFSSLEHTGLGRYGDRLDPEGDIKEMQKLACILPDGALVFLGLPVGADAVYWNAHRIYGNWRLPLMTAGYDVIGLYTNESVPDPVSFVKRPGQEQQAIVVMRNSPNEKDC